MYGYYSDFLELTSPSGCATRLFDGCRTLSNAAAGAAHNVWEPNLDTQSWQGCCCWTYAAESYDPAINPDPWYDPLNPATSEVAGALIDPPDQDGNGFYIESSNTIRAREAGFVPLEAYITFTVVSQTARGERAFLDFLTQTLTQTDAECDGFTAEVRTECPCETDQPDDPDTPIDPGAPEPSDTVCEPSDELQPFTGSTQVFYDRGLRQLLKLRFIGLEQLTDDQFWECAGNRYKLSFEIDDKAFFGEPSFVCELGGSGTWDACECLCDPVGICCDPDPTICGPEPADTATITPPSRVQSTNTVGGLICLDGRWSKPDRFMMQTCLTPPQPESLTSRLQVEIVNGSSHVYNARLVVWQAVDGVQRPDTNDGWGYYRCETPVYDLPIIELEPYEKLTRNLDCTTTVECVNGETHSGVGSVEPAGCCESLGCGNRYWVALTMTCDPLGYGNLDLQATVSTAAVWPI